ncbi:MAG: COP23 domain-containing protein [Oscillatoria princeps RMCB-10]|nr:COP23 domain-containing protein [Oscillatoria princeps RMCB-10]
MKTQLFGPLLAGLALALGALAAISQPVRAQTTTYFCDKSKGGVPATFARNATGKKIEVIRWEKEWGGITREDRCQIVSARFQSASEQGILGFLTSGVKNGENVLCAAKEYGAPCSQLLFTLRKEDKPRQVIDDLFGVGYRAKGPLIQSLDGEPQIYIDMELLLQEAPAQE